jgi:hypothetical protein
MKEIWKEINGYNGYYKVSNLGRVKSIDRIVTMKNYVKRFYKGTILKQSLTGSHAKYLSVNLHSPNKTGTRKVHQLVAEAFLNHTPCGMNIVINHIDEDKLNNRLDNLELTSSRENSTNYIRSGVTSVYTGVSWYKAYNKWRVKVYHNKKNHHVGYFNDELEASEAYLSKLKELDATL